MTSALLALLVLAPADLTFVRHAETVANATGRYSEKTLDALSEKGQRQVAALTQNLLRQPRFDRILVSPSPRALKTIAPYLRATGQRAVVWPLLYECCTQRKKAREPKNFKWGPRVTIPAGLAPYFTVMADSNRLPDAPDYASGLAQVQESVRQFRANYSVGRVLLVGHSAHGGHFLHELTGRWIKVENATPIHVSIVGGRALSR